MNKPEFIIILINFNNFNDTIECLESIFKSKEDFKVVVIDNSTTQDPINQLELWANGEIIEIETKYPDLVYPLEKKPIEYIKHNEDDFYKKPIEKKLTLVKANKNKGFAAANNIALKNINAYNSSETIIWILNNDTLITNTCIKKIKKEAEKIRNNDLFGTPLIDYDSNKLQAIGGKFNPFTGNSKIIGHSQELKEYSNLIKKKIDFPIGASMIIKNSFLDTIGFMNESYFLFFEELDWSYKLKKNKGIVKILDVLGVYHKQGGSTASKNYNKISPFIMETYIRSKLTFAQLHLKKHKLFIYLYTLCITLPKYFKKNIILFVFSL
jgi:GT2 family glycosyltransferase